MVMLFQSIRNENTKFKNESPSQPDWGPILKKSFLPDISLYSLSVERTSYCISYAQAPIYPLPALPIFICQLVSFDFYLFSTNSCVGMLIIDECDGIDIGSFRFSNVRYQSEVHQHILFIESLFCHSLNLWIWTYTSLSNMYFVFYWSSLSPPPTKQHGKYL